MSIKKSKSIKTKSNYISEAEERIITYLQKNHFANNTMIVHQLAELSNKKINPHIVTEALHKLTKEKVISKINQPFSNQVNIPCYIYEFSKNFKLDLVKKRKEQIFPYLDILKNNKNPNHNNLHKQLGYALEIPVFERLNQLAANHNYKLQGKFKNYANYDYKTAKKTEPTKLINNIKTKGKVDFILETGNDILIIECKNIRNWIYPNNSEFLKLLQKAIDTNTIPVLIARKHHFTMNIFRLAGLITHDTYKQIYPAHEYDFASKIRSIEILGYHDIAIHNEYKINENNQNYKHYKNLDHFNNNLNHFISKNLLPSAKKARKLFNLAKPCLQQWIDKEITLAQLYQIVKNNSKPTNEINKPIEDNIDFVNQFKMNKIY